MDDPARSLDEGRRASPDRSAGRSMPTGCATHVGGDGMFAPGDDGYDEARAVWNAMIDRCPDVIVRCQTDGATWPRPSRSPATTASRCPSAAAATTLRATPVADGGVMVDLSAMHDVRVDPEARRAFVEGGATWAAVDRATQELRLGHAGRPDL